MPGVQANNVGVFVDKYNLGTQLKDMNFERSAEILDSSTFTGNNRTKVSDLKDAKLGGSGYWSSTVGDVDDQMTAIFSAEKYYTVVMEGPFMDKRAVFFAGIDNKYNIGGKLGSLVAVDFETAVDGLVDSGKIILPLSNYTTGGFNVPGTPAYADFGVTGANWVMLVHVLSVAGTASPSMLVVPQHSADGVTWVTLAGPGITVTAPGAYIITGTTATLNRYIRVNRAAMTGTSPNFQAVVAFAQRA